MIRSFILGLVATLVFGSAPAFAAPPPLPHVGSTPVASAPIDLAAMTLSPNDVPTPGFGLESSDSYLIDSYGGDIRPALESAGYVRGYESQLSLAEASGQTITRVKTTLDLFADVDGVKPGFSAFAAYNNSGATVLQGTSSIGDESALFFERQTDNPTGKTATLHTLLFRTGPIVATIYWQTWKGTPPDVSFIESLGDNFLAKIQAGLAGAGPGLSLKVARLRVDYTLSQFDGYWRLAGQDFRYWNETDAVAAERMAPFKDAMSVYATVQATTDQKSAPNVFWRVATFSNAANAADWANHYPGIFSSLSHRPVNQAADAATFGDGSASFTYQYQAATGLTMYGLMIVTHVGTTGVVLHIQGGAKTPMSAAETLMTAEAHCAAGPDPCPDVPLPVTLAGGPSSS